MYVFLVLIFSFSVFSNIDPELIRRIDKVISPQIGHTASSVVIGISQKGETHYLTYGNAKPDSFFEIGSITKTFTSLLFSIAIDKGLVTPETKLSEIRPEWKNQKAGSITLIELATHRSGLTRLPCDFHPKDESNPYADYTEKQVIRSITDKVLARNKKCKLNEHPTSSIEYSNWGIALLGNAISAKANLTYAELLAQWIAEPLGLSDTVTKLNDEQKSRLLPGHDAQMKPTPNWTRQGMMGNGAILSTARDLTKYARAMLHPESTPFPSAIKRVETLQYGSIAYNWFVTAGGNLWHNGQTGGYTALMKLYLKADVSVFSLSDVSLELRCLIEAIDQVPCDPNLR